MSEKIWLSSPHMSNEGYEQEYIVFCQDLTFSATANPIIYQNATPVFIDSNYETWNMDPEYIVKFPKNFKFQEEFALICRTL